MDRYASYAPLVVFTYNRPQHLISLLQSLREQPVAADTDIFFYSDGPKSDQDAVDVNSVRSVLREFASSEIYKSVSIVESSHNNGLAQSVISGVSDVLAKYGKVIVLEDDLVVCPFFLEYMNSALEHYANDSRIWSISGYSFPVRSVGKDVFFSGRACSWGWATWSDRWNEVDWKVSDYPSFRRNFKSRHSFSRWGADMPDMLDRCMRGKINSWAIRWCYAAWKNRMYTVYPVKSYVMNMGTDGSGTNFTKVDSRFETLFAECPDNVNFVSYYHSEQIRKEFRSRFTPFLLWAKIQLRVAVNFIKPYSK